eukprot:4576764-Alexandrium_andersonii.AAC.1
MAGDLHRRLARDVLHVSRLAPPRQAQRATRELPGLGLQELPRLEAGAWPPAGGPRSGGFSYGRQPRRGDREQRP